MVKTEEFAKNVADMMSAFPMDPMAFQDALRSQASLTEKMSNVVLKAAEQSTEVSNKWAKQTLSRLAPIAKAKEGPTDYAKGVTDFASASAEMAAEHMAAFAEIAKKAQVETVELLMSASKTATQEATAAVQKAASDINTAARKATSGK